MGVCVVEYNHSTDPLLDLIWQEGTNHGKDRPEEHWLVDQMNSSNFQWKRVLTNKDTHTSVKWNN